MKRMKWMRMCQSCCVRWTIILVGLMLFFLYLSVKLFSCSSSSMSELIIMMIIKMMMTMMMVMVMWPLEFTTSLSIFLACVNSVRWSCGGKYLATGGDDKLIMIWQMARYDHDKKGACNRLHILYFSQRKQFYTRHN